MVGFISLNDLGSDVKRAVFSACTILTLLLSLTLISKWITIMMMVIFGGMASFMAYHLFLKKYIIKKEGIINVAVTVKDKQ
jgi:hypothetical protein